MQEINIQKMHESFAHFCAGTTSWLTLCRSRSSSSPCTCSHPPVPPSESTRYEDSQASMLAFIKLRTLQGHPAALVPAAPPWCPQRLPGTKVHKVLSRSHREMHWALMLSRNLRKSLPPLRPVPSSENIPGTRFARFPKIVLQIVSRQRCLHPWFYRVVPSSQNTR